MSQPNETDAPGLPASLDSDPSFAAGSAVLAAAAAAVPPAAAAASSPPGSGAAWLNGAAAGERDAMDFLRPSDSRHLLEEERRLALDGNPYTFDEFVDYYGEEWATQLWNSADIHRAEESRGGPLQIRANDAVSIYAQLEAQQPQYRDDHTLYVYDRTTFPNPYVPDDFYEPLSPDMAITQNEMDDIRSKYGWWLTDRQCWVRLRKTVSQELQQTAYERRQRRREDKARRASTSGVPSPALGRAGPNADYMHSDGSHFAMQPPAHK